MRREETCCFTGHRPDKLPWGADEEDPRCRRLKKKLRERLEAAYGRGMRHFICGMARGTDLYFGEAVLELKNAHPEVTLEAAIPCESQPEGWPEDEKKRYRALLDRCDFETMVQRRFDRNCMMRRNRYMVDRSALVLSVFDGVAGGTRNTLAYAMGQQVPVDLIPLGEFR